MSANIGTVDTRILLATGNNEPVEVGTVTTELRARFDGVEFTVAHWRYRRSLALAFFRMAVHTLTSRP